MEDSNLRRLWRLNNTFARVARGTLQKDLFTFEAGMSMKTKDTWTICPKTSDIYSRPNANSVHESGLWEDNLPVQSGVSRTLSCPLSAAGVMDSKRGGIR